MINKLCYTTFKTKWGVLNLINTNNPLDENSLDKPNENAFYQEKMKNITDDGIHELFKNLSADFCDSKYHADENKFVTSYDDQEYIKQWKQNCEVAKTKSKEYFKSPDFSWTGDDKDKKFAPFIFFETIDLKEIEGDEAIANYVKQFVYYINQLLFDADFFDFLFYGFVLTNGGEKNKSIMEFVNQIDSEFFTKCNKADLKLFKDSGLMYIGACISERFTTYSLKSMRFIEYLKKTPVIPVIVLEKMLFDDYFFKAFSKIESIDVENIDDIQSKIKSIDVENFNDIKDTIIKSIAKTDFRSWFSAEQYEDELLNLGSLLNPSYYRNGKTNFYTIDADGQIKDALIEKCAEIFNKPEAKSIKLYDFMTETPYENVYSFVSDYLKDDKNKNSPARQRLIDGLKTWAKNNDNFIDYDCIEKITSVSYIDYSYRYSYFFPCDTEFNKIIADRCYNAIKTHLETISDKFKRMEEYLSIKSCVEDFFSIKLNIDIDYNKIVEDHLNTIKGVIGRMEKYLSIKRRLKENLGVELSINIGISNEPYKSHGKDVAWLSLYIFLLLLCFGAMIAGFILIPITPLKFLCLFVFYPISEIYNPMKERCIKIDDDRIYNAKLCIYKFTSKDLAVRQLSWDMLRRDEIKRALNKQFPDSQNPLGQNQI